MMNQTAIVLGASGLVGSHLVKLLEADSRFTKVICLSRKEISFSSPKVQNVLVDFNQLEKYADYFQGDCFFSCLGTTIANAGSKEKFSLVDFEYQVAAAKIAFQQGVKMHLLVSALGVSASSPIFYNQVKGKVEDAINQIGFANNYILRPSILLGNRTETRKGEAAAQWLAAKFDFLFMGPLAKYKGVKADEVAKTLAYAAIHPKGKKIIIENEEIIDLAKLYSQQ